MIATSARFARHFAVVGAGIAGLACARTLAQAGHAVTVFEAEDSVGGRMRSKPSPFGDFDVGAQYFTVRDPRFAQALSATAADLTRRWSSNAVRVLDPEGRVIEAALPGRESHWVAAPSMQALPARWAAPLLTAGQVLLGARVSMLQPDAADPSNWQLHVQGPDGARQVHAGFDAVVLALPVSAARQLLALSKLTRSLTKPLERVEVAPCWTLSIAFPNAIQPALQALGPQWNVARSTHHRVAWLARESSKPGRSAIERWTAQAGAAWSQEHAQDDAERVTAKLLKAFAEVTGIRATPSWTEAVLWHQAQTVQPLGQSHLWDAQQKLGLCGDWCTGHRVEDAFLSGLGLALQVA